MNRDYLWEKAGTMIQRGLRDDAIHEIMLNPDGRLWFKHKSDGNQEMADMVTHQASAFVHALAQYENKFLNDKTPYLDATLPFAGERVNVTVPPITENISFNIRKKSKIVFTLDDYIRLKIMTAGQGTLLKNAIFKRKNILVSGSPASGKTTLANALLDEMARVVPAGHRVVILEQVPELQCKVPNQKSMLVSEHVSMNNLLWISMRNAPDRIVVGEVRDGAALSMLKSWNTGCPGGVATIHANSAGAAVQRVLDLACEAVATPPFSLAAEALDVIVQIEECAQHPERRVVTEIAQVAGFDPQTRRFSIERLDE